MSSGFLKVYRSGCALSQEVKVVSLVRVGF